MDLVAERPRTVVLRAPAPYGAPDPIAIDVTIGTPPLVVDGCQILELVWSWGASADAGVLTTADAGAGTLRLLDPLRLFDPTNDASPNVGIGIGSTVAIDVNGAPAFRGRIDDVAHDLTIATLTLADRVASLAGVEFPSTAVPAETASARVGRILDAAGWPAADRDVSPGGVPLQAGTIAADAWTELVAVTRNELGAVWIRPDGRVAWRSRATAWASSAPAGVFGCSPTIAYVAAIETQADQSSLVNEIAAARRTGTQAITKDPASQARYGRRTHVQNDLELATDGDRDLWASFYLTRQASPTIGVAGFPFRPDAAAIAAVLAFELGTIVRVVDEHHGATLDRLARWVGARWSVSPIALEVLAVTGQDASIRAVTRSRILDTGTEWAGAQVTPAPTNVAAREPGLQLAVIPRRPVGSTAQLRPTRRSNAE